MFLQNHITKVLNCLSMDFSQHVKFFTRARFTFSPGFFHLLAANSTQIFDLLMNMTHEASSNLKSQTQALIKHAGKLENKQKKASWEANNASFTNLKRNARIPSFPEISTSQDDTSTSPTAPGIPGTGSTPRSSSTHTSIGHRLPKPGTWEFHSVDNINIIYIYYIYVIYIYYISYIYMQFLHIYIYTIMSWDHNHHNLS